MGRQHRQHKESKTRDFIDSVNTSLNAETLKVVDPKKCQPKSDADILNEIKSENQETKLSFQPPCRTQSMLPQNLSKLPKSGDPLSIFVGMFGAIPRWKKGSTVNFAAYANGYLAPQDAVYAAQQLNQAAIYWNSLNVGASFSWVGKLEDAEFVLGYAGDQGNLVAQAFFPNANDLNNLIVCKRAFDPDIKQYMWRFFLHELGHVLGLRHEFAMDPKPGSNPPVPMEGGAVQIGPRNAASVMNYGPTPPLIQQSDIDSTQAFYNLVGPTFGGWPIQLFVPDN